MVLQQIIGAQARAQQLPRPQALAIPSWSLLQPLVNQVAAKVNISPAIATIIVSIALKYLLQELIRLRPIKAP